MSTKSFAASSKKKQRTCAWSCVHEFRPPSSGPFDFDNPKWCAVRRYLRSSVSKYSYAFDLVKQNRRIKSISLIRRFQKYQATFLFSRVPNSIDHRIFQRLPLRSCDPTSASKGAKILPPHAKQTIVSTLKKKSVPRTGGPETRKRSLFD